MDLSIFNVNYRSVLRSIAVPLLVMQLAILLLPLLFLQPSFPKLMAFLASEYVVLSYALIAVCLLGVVDIGLAYWLLRKVRVDDKHEIVFFGGAPLSLLWEANRTMQKTEKEFRRIEQEHPALLENPRYKRAMENQDYGYASYIIERYAWNLKNAKLREAKKALRRDRKVQEQLRELVERGNAVGVHAAQLQELSSVGNLDGMKELVEKREAEMALIRASTSIFCGTLIENTIRNEGIEAARTLLHRLTAFVQYARARGSEREMLGHLSVGNVAAAEQLHADTRERADWEEDRERYLARIHSSLRGKGEAPVIAELEAIGANHRHGSREYKKAIYQLEQKLK